MSFWGFLLLQPAFNAYPPYDASCPTPAAYPPAIPTQPSMNPSYPAVNPSYPAAGAHHSYPAIPPHAAPVPGPQGGISHGYPTPGYPSAAMSYDHGFQVVNDELVYSTSSLMT